jgi:hypothetical protein
MSAEVHWTRGYHPRFVPPPGFLTLLAVFSLQRLPITRTGATHGVHPSELSPPAGPYAFRRRGPLAVSDIALFCSEDQKITMPRSSRALLPAGIRARPGRSPAGSMLSWVSRRLFRARPERRGIGFPTPSLLRFSYPRPEGRTHAALQGLAGHSSSRDLATPQTLMRFATGTCPRALPTTVASQFG